MAANVQVNVYQINQNVLDRDASQRIGFPTASVVLRSCIGSPTRSLSSGYNVYSIIQTTDGSLYYCGETIAALSTLVG